MRSARCCLLSISILVSLLSCAAAQAQEDRYRLEDCDPRLLALVEAGPKWLGKDDVALSASVPGAETTKKEVENLLALQRGRTPEDVRQIEAEVGDLALVFLGRLGATTAKHPNTFKLLQAALAEADYFIFAEKFQLMRRRPHQVDARITPAIRVPRHPAFPSGHGGEAWTLGRVACALRPGQCDPIMAYATAVGTRRELAGVHYPSDTAEGVRIGELVATKLLALPAFRRLVDAARSEWN